MTVLGQPRVGQVGFGLEIDLREADGAPINLATATVLRIVVEAPDGSTTVYQIGDGVGFVTDGTDGRFTFASIAGTFAAAGRHRFAGFVQLSSGRQLVSSWGEVYVQPALPVS